MPASVRRVGVDEVSFRGTGKRLPEIRTLKLPIHGAENPGTFGNLIRDLRDVGPSESGRLTAERDIELPLTVEAHDSIETRSIEKHEGKGRWLPVELIPDFIIHGFTLSFESGSLFQQVFANPTARNFSSLNIAIETDDVFV
jgi:hypothetical protein